MKTRQLLIGICFIFLFALSINSVLGAADNVLEPIFKTLESFKFAENYDRYHLIVDFIIYIIIFVGISKHLMRNRLGNGPAAGLGIALALSLTLFEYKQGFSILNLSIFAALIFTVILGFYLYKMISSTGANKSSSFAWAFVVIFLVLQGTSPGLFEVLARDYPTMYGILSLFFIIALIKAIISIFGMFGGGGSGSSWLNPFKGGNKDALGNPYTKTPEQKREEELLRREGAEAKKATKAELKAIENTRHLESLQNLIEKVNSEDINNLAKGANSLKKQIELINKVKEFLSSAFRISEEIKKIPDIDINRLTDESKNKIIEYMNNYTIFCQKIFEIISIAKENFKHDFDVFNIKGKTTDELKNIRTQCVKKQEQVKKDIKKINLHLNRVNELTKKVTNKPVKRMIENVKNLNVSNKNINDYFAEFNLLSNHYNSLLDDYLMIINQSFKDEGIKVFNNRINKIKEVFTAYSKLYPNAATFKYIKGRGSEDIKTTYSLIDKTILPFLNERLQKTSEVYRKMKEELIPTIEKLNETSENLGKSQRTALSLSEKLLKKLEELLKPNSGKADSTNGL